MNYIMEYNGVRIKPMGLKHVDCYAALCPKKNRDSVKRRLHDELTADMKKGFIRHFIIINNDFIVGMVTLEYIKDLYNGYEVYTDANMRIYIPQDRHHHLKNHVAIATINLCKATGIVDNLGISAGKNAWIRMEINPNVDSVITESEKEKTA